MARSPKKSFRVRLPPSLNMVFEQVLVAKMVRQVVGPELPPDAPQALRAAFESVRDRTAASASVGTGGAGSAAWPSGRLRGINYRLLRAITMGHGPWDIKRGLLSGPTAQKNAAASMERGGSGKPYVDVPLKVHGHVIVSLPRGPFSASGAFTPFEDSCRRCGKPNAGGYRFCLGCGGDLKKDVKLQPGVPLPEVRMGFSRGRVIWRRVSENSDPASWIHPGFRARALAMGYGVRARTSHPAWQAVKEHDKAFYNELKADIQRDMRRQRRSR